jgi:diguanylate cyclase (GGDEF)-like protein
MRLGWIALAVSATLAVPTVLRPGGSIASFTYLVGLALIVACLWYGAARQTGAAHRGWRLIAMAGTCWLIGDVLQRILSAFDFPEDSVGPQDLFWFASYPLMVAAVLAWINERRLHPTVMREIRLDVAAVTVAIALGAWKLMIVPGIDGGTLSLSNIAAAVYPLGDVAIFAIALTLLMAPGRRSAAGVLLITCLGSTLVLDTLFSVLPTMAPAFDVARLDGALLVVNALLAAAVLHPSSGVLAEPVTGSRSSLMYRWRVFLLGAALVAISVTAALPTSQASAIDRAVLLVAAVTVSGIILARFYGVVQQRESAEASLVYQAQHDALTGLANRSLLLHRLGVELLKADADTPHHLVLLYLDLDDFKAINDGWGHSAGDHVLRVVGDRLVKLTRRGDTVARLGGDEFVVLCVDVPRDAAADLGRALCDAVGAPIELLSGDVVSVGASVGMYSTPSLDDFAPTVMADVESLLHAADSAMYDAKHSGGGVRTC